MSLIYILILAYLALRGRCFSLVICSRIPLYMQFGLLLVPAFKRRPSYLFYSLSIHLHPVVFCPTLNCRFTSPLIPYNLPSPKLTQSSPHRCLERLPILLHPTACLLPPCFVELGNPIGLVGFDPVRALLLIFRLWPLYAQVFHRRGFGEEIRDRADNNGYGQEEVAEDRNGAQTAY